MACSWSCFCFSSYTEKLLPQSIFGLAIYLFIMRCPIYALTSAMYFYSSSSHNVRRLAQRSKIVSNVNTFLEGCADLHVGFSSIFGACEQWPKKFDGLRNSLHRDVDRVESGLVDTIRWY